MRNFCVVAVALAVVVCPVDVLFGQAPTPTELSSTSHLLASVKWAGPAVSIESLRGKTVLVLIYAIWCPCCNKWSGEFFTQLRNAVKDKPVIILAINADVTPDTVKEYLVERNFFAPNILHGYDPSLPKKLGFSSNLFRYLLIDPSGSPIDNGRAGSYHKRPQGKVFSLPNRLTTSDDLGEFNIITPDMPPQVKRLLWPMELGYSSEISMKKLRRQVSGQDRKAFDNATAGFFDKQMQHVRELYSGEVQDQLLAYETATMLSSMFKATTQGKESKQLLAQFEEDSEFKRELSAKKCFQRSMRLATANPKRRNSLLKSIVKRFEGTYYGRMARDAIDVE